MPFAVLAHPGVGGTAGFAAGFLHPLTGPDHMLAMIAVGIWGSQLGKRGLWALPVIFALVMAIFGVLGGRGVLLPGVEVGVATSALAIGLTILLAARPPLGVAAALVGMFAVFHGYAHAAELTGATAPLAFGVGILVATGMLHAVGIAIGGLSSLSSGSRALRTVGAGIAASGMYFLTTAL